MANDKDIPPITHAGMVREISCSYDMRLHVIMDDVLPGLRPRGIPADRSGQLLLDKSALAELTGNIQALLERQTGSSMTLSLDGLEVVIDLSQRSVTINGQVLK